MKMKWIACVLGLMMMTGTALAGNLPNRPYFAIRGGMDRMELKSAGEKVDKSRFSWMVALGMRLRSVRIEAELADIIRGSYQALKLEQQRYMMQLYYDIPLRMALRPYINVGVGAAYTDASLGDDSDDSITPTWNAGVGLGLNVTRNFSFDLGYRYVDAGKPKMMGTKIKSRSNQIYFGVRASF